MGYGEHGDGTIMEGAGEWEKHEGLVMGCAPNLDTEHIIALDI